MRRLLLPCLALALACLCGLARADGQKLRIITWADYVPPDLVAAFTKETGIEVEVTLSNNEEMISKLRATGGAGYDLAQPSQDRITSVERDFGIYKPFDLSKIKLDEFQPSLLGIVRRNATIDGKLYALPYLWGTDGLVVNTKRAAGVTDFPDLCRADLKGKTSIRLRRPILMAFAFASGKDPFALYGDPKAYAALMDRVGDTLIACKPNFLFFFDNKDQLLNGFRSGEIWAAAMWDTGGWTLNRENPDIRYVVPKSGALGWIDTFALPARGRNDAAAYAWINFAMRPENAARVIKSVGNFSAAKGTAPFVDPHLKAQFVASFPQSAFENIHWYPAIPPGLEEIDGRVLDRIKAAD
ncbi:MAG TPA: extracellular solute-binding protein [Steroidobacteraceae bacterium]|jgi:spermidine/putrescine transport system substrate-binding protein|nr:extracellular solute-binding protein [Steroidobacteraceae bacterium]